MHCVAKQRAGNIVLQTSSPVHPWQANCRPCNCMHSACVMRFGQGCCVPPLWPSNGAQKLLGLGKHLLTDMGAQDSDDHRPIHVKQHLNATQIDHLQAHRTAEPEEGGRGTAAAGHCCGRAPPPESSLPRQWGRRWASSRRTPYSSLIALHKKPLNLCKRQGLFCNVRAAGHLPRCRSTARAWDPP